jgi:hypothetical protein
MFRVGQKVVCVDDSPTDADGGKELERGQIYTVRWCGVWGWPSVYKDEVCVRIFEVVRGPDEWVPECVDLPFSVHRFRPIVSRKTDISALKALLVPGAKIRETA